MSTSPISTSSLPPIDPALEPAAIRNGNQKAKQAYQVGLAFEQMLVDQLARQLASTSGLDGSGAGSSGDGSSDPGGSSDPATSMYGQMLPDALTSGVMSGGGLGVAAQIAQSLDPALGGKL